MTKEQWLKLPLPTNPLIPNLIYRGKRVTWSSGIEAYYTVQYKF